MGTFANSNPKFENDPWARIGRAVLLFSTTRRANRNRYVLMLLEWLANLGLSGYQRVTNELKILVWVRVPYTRCEALTSGPKPEHRSVVDEIRRPRFFNARYSSHRCVREAGSAKSTGREPLQEIT